MVYPGEVLDGQADLRDRLASAGVAGVVAETMVGMFVPHRDETVEMVRKTVPVHVAAAYAYRVTADMVELVKFAADRLDDGDEEDPSLAPTGCGIVRFDEPLLLTDLRGDVARVDWVVWGPAREVGGRSGLAFWEFNDGWSDPDVVTERLRERFADSAGRLLLDGMGRWMPVEMSAYLHGRALGPRLVEAGGRQLEALAAEAEPIVPHKATNMKRLMHALFLLMGQTVTEVSEDRLDRAARKRAERHGLPPRVSVIRLRRSEAGPQREGESLVQWSHRWIVRGHWRWQACGPGRSERRRIWVNPFVKGPDGAPLVVSDKVYSLER